MRKFDGYQYLDMTPEEIADLDIEVQQKERQYWLNTPYDEAVNAEIRKRYSESQEFSILRQRDEKPDEYAEYYAYCEQCKAYAKSKRQEVAS